MGSVWDQCGISAGSMWEWDHSGIDHNGITVGSEWEHSGSTPVGAQWEHSEKSFSSKFSPPHCLSAEEKRNLKGGAG